MLDRIKDNPERFGTLLGEVFIAALFGAGAAWLSLRFGGLIGCVGWIIVAACAIAALSEFGKWLKDTGEGETDRGLGRLHEALEKLRTSEDPDDDEAAEVVYASSADDDGDSDDDSDERDSPFDDDDESEDPYGPGAFRYLVQRYERTPAGIVPRGEFIECVVADSPSEAERAMRRRYPFPSHVYYRGRVGG